MAARGANTPGIKKLMEAEARAADLVKQAKNGAFRTGVPSVKCVRDLECVPVGVCEGKDTEGCRRLDSLFGEGTAEEGRGR